MRTKGYCCRKPPTPPSGDLRTPPLGCLPHPSCPANSFAEKEPRHDNWRNVTILAGSGHRRTTHAGVHEPVNIASAPAGRWEMQRFRHQWNEHRHLPHEDARLHIKQKRSIRWLTWHRGLVWGKERLPPTPIPYSAPFVRTLRRGSHDPNCWVRDVHEEGIEPHPGPWFITKNINGMNNKKSNAKYLRT